MALNKPYMSIDDGDRSAESCVVDPDVNVAEYDNRKTSPRRARRTEIPHSLKVYEQVDDSGSVAVVAYEPETYSRHLVLAVIALFIAFPFGVIALMLAASARSKIRSQFDDERHSARQEARISLGLSISGIVIVVFVVVVAVSATAGSSSNQFDDQTTPIPPTMFKFPSTTTTLATTPAPGPCTLHEYNGKCYTFLLVYNPDTWFRVTTPSSVNASASNVSDASTGASGTITTEISNAVTTPSSGDNATNNESAIVLPPLSWCRFGVADATNQSLCYYNKRSPVESDKQCQGDLNPEDGNCYSTYPCETAANYHNRICYLYALPVGLGRSDDCLHGFYAGGLCYYDESWRAPNDVMCGGFRGDRGIGLADDGYCYASSPDSCPYARNYFDNKCYEYVIRTKLTFCKRGHYVAIPGQSDGLCYYNVAKPSSNCNPSVEDQHGFYCYSLS